MKNKMRDQFAHLQDDTQDNIRTSMDSKIFFMFRKTPSKADMSMVN